MSRKTTTLKRNASFETSQAAMSSECIQGFIDYLISKKDIVGINSSLKQKLSITTIDTVEENLIDFMKERGVKNLSFELVNELTDYICSVNEPTRNGLLTILVKWFGKGADLTIPISEMRGEMTFDTGLPAATMMMDKTYTTIRFDKKSKSSIDLSPDEIGWINSMNTSNKFKSGKKQKCSECWMCGRDVFVYELIDNKNLEKYRKCGEDEHVFPPGLGNILGFLYPTYQEQVQSITNIILTSEGLKSAHAWCNQVKSGLGLILPPIKGFREYRINKLSLTLLLDKAVDWLNQGKNRKIGIDLFHHNMSKTDRPLYIDEMKTQITKVLSLICTELNRYITSDAIVDNKNIEIMYKLRTIFFGCLLGNNLFKGLSSLSNWDKFTTPDLTSSITRKKKQGGKRIIQYGGDNIETYIKDSIEPMDDIGFSIISFLDKSISNDVCYDESSLVEYEIGGHSLRLTKKRQERILRKLEEEHAIVEQPSGSMHRGSTLNSQISEKEGCLSRWCPSLFSTKKKGGKNKIKKNKTKKNKTKKQNNKR